MKIKAKTYKGKRIVMGNKNLVTKNEIHVNDIPQQGGNSGGGGGGSASGNDYQYIDLSKISGETLPLVVAYSIMSKVDTTDTGYLIMPSGTLLELGNSFVYTIKAVVISPSMKTMILGQENTVEQLIQTNGIDLSHALITEEEFYKLN